MKKLVLLLIPIGLGLAAYYFYSEYNRKPAAMTELKSVNIFTSEELYSEFKNNEASSNEKYLNKPIEVIGKAIAVNKGDDGVTTVTIDSGDPMGVISCEVANTELQKTAIIAAQENIRIKGICTGFLTDVILKNCVIISVDNKL
jgi:hypothetical protein